jgi:uncharacterized protein (DUF58 family)
VTTALKTLQLKAKKQVYTLLSGHSLSKLNGEGYDFSELREYQVGDDIRKINWMITAKLGKPYIKELHSNRELSVVVAVLMDGSVYFNSDNAKQHKLCEVATLLGYATQQNSDLFQGLLYTSSTTYATAPTKQLFDVEQFSQKLYETSLLGSKLDYAKSIDDIFKRVHRASLVFVLADFLEEIDLSLLSQKHEVIAIVVRKKEEEVPKRLLDVTLISPKSKNKVDTHFTNKSVNNYISKLKEHDKKQQEHFASCGIRFVKIFCDDNIVEKLVKLF